jgi:hypothetical protein
MITDLVHVSIISIGGGLSRLPTQDVPALFGAAFNEWLVAISPAGTTLTVSATLITNPFT